MSAELDVERRASLALRYLEEGKGLVDKDPVQASEKLYKAAEETVKALAIRFGLGEVLKRVSERGRWTVTELEKAVSRISESLGVVRRCVGRCELLARVGLSRGKARRRGCEEEVAAHREGRLGGTEDRLESREES